jgi:thiol-disulfide isomerase/thioredoxin
MSFEVKIGLLVALVALAAIVGLIWKARTGRAKQVDSGDRIDLAELGIVKDGKAVTALTTRVTFLQFSTDFCTFCGPTAKMLQTLEKSDPNVTHLEVNVTERLDLVKKYNILQTPTTLVLDQQGNIQSRIGGAPKAHTLVTEIGNFDI